MAHLVRGHLAVVARELPYATVFFHEWRYLSKPYQEEIKALRDRYEGAFRQVIEEGVAAGEFVCEDPSLGARFVLGALNWTYQWFRPEGALDVAALADRYTAMVLRSLGKEEA